MMLTQSRLKELLHYDPETGVFTRATKRFGIRVGDIAGNIYKGYVRIKVDNKLYRAHRLAFLYMLGTWPEDQVDHIDLCRANNIWANLREATHAQNQHNTQKPKRNKSGYKGVYFAKDRAKYRAEIRINKKSTRLGQFNTPEEAYEAYCAAAKIYHKEFARI